MFLEHNVSRSGKIPRNMNDCILSWSRNGSRQNPVRSRQYGDNRAEATDPL